MTTINVNATIHVCEDTPETFDVAKILAAAGYVGSGNVSINSMLVIMPDGSFVEANTGLFGTTDGGKTLYVDPAAWKANYNGEFDTGEMVIDVGNGNTITLSLQVVVDPVNDAPAAADKTFELTNGNAVTLAIADFGFHDDVEHNNFQSIIVTTAPSAGQLLVNGVAVAVGTEILASDIAAGHVQFVPSQTSAGAFELGFKVRDDGGTVGCGAADISASPNYLTFKVPMATIGDFVWNDKNANGLQDAGETGVAGVTVHLKDAAGNEVATTTTDASGAYHFTVAGGSYSVSVDAPAGYAASPQTQGTNGAVDSNIDAAGKSALFTVAPGETNNTIDAGLYQTASLGDRVWLDSNKNGIQDAGETGVANVKVTLLDASGHALATATTDATGNYLFPNLAPGSYSVQFDKSTLPAGYVFTSTHQGGDTGADSDASSVDGSTAQVVLAAGETNLSLDAGIVATPATIGDKVWLDANGNGIQDAGEAGIAGVTVQLKNTAGDVITTTTTDASGNYHFSVDPGTYSVAVVAPAGYVVTTQNAGSDTAVDSNIDASGNTAQVTVAAGATNNTIDAGLYKTASLGDRVWLDCNGNGVQDAGDTGVKGVKVYLLDASGNVVGSPVVTDANGNYLFTGLKPGSYSVQFDKTTLPAGYGFTKADAGSDDAKDSDANVNTGITQQVTLASGDSNLTLDAGIVKQAKATIGDKVWEDTNGNGIQDKGESGIACVTVQLKDAAGKVIATTQTDSSGNYSFSVDAGTYSVAVVSPKGYVATLQNAGSNEAVDSDINAAGQSDSVTVAWGQNYKDLDAGLVKTASIGDRVWLDCNANGIQDKGDTGVAGVKVYLLDASGNVVGSPVLTDKNGNYLFTGLQPGTYSVQFDKTTLPAGYVFTTANVGKNDAVDSDADVSTGITHAVTVASGDSNTSLDAGIVKAPKATIGDKVWEDTNGNGIQDKGESGIACVTVQLKDAAGKVVATTTTDSSGNYSFSVDAGTYSVAVVAPKGYVATVQNAGSNDSVDSDINAAGQSDSVTVVAGQNYKDLDAGLIKTASIGDRVWVDCNANGIQDKGDDGIAGVKVYLLDASGKVVGSPVVTDANGNYLFTGLPPGTYSVQFDKTTLPAGYVFTTANVGKNDAIDSDADVTTGITHQVTVAGGDTVTSLDAGIVKAPKATIGDKVWEDTNGNGIQDSGECGIACVTVQLKNAAGKVVDTTTTDSSGNYSFSVDPGTYSVVVVAPKGYVATLQNAGSNDAVDSDINAAGQSDSVTVLSGQNYKNLDAGLVQTACIGDRVWVDTNGNGVQDKGEAGAAGVKVTLLDASGHVVGSPVVTDASGNYQFTGLKPGTYSVQFDKTTLPAGYVFTTANVGKNDAVDSDADVSTGITHQVTVASGDSISALDAGIVKAPKATIGDKVWEDANGNGIQDSGECGIACVTVQLKDAAGKVVDTTTTDSNGNYSFSVAAGTYSVLVQAPTGYVVTAKDVGKNDAIDSDASSTGQTGTVTVAAGETNNTLDVGLVQKAAIGDRVWFDANGNGVQDSGEKGMTGVTVNLLDAAGKVVATACTDCNGNYLFSNLLPGTYSVAFVAPAGYLFTTQDAGKSGSTDSDADSSGHTTAIALVSGDVQKNWDAGLVKAASIGDKVWEDTNYNGVQDAGESGLAGVKVNLLDTKGNVLETTTTDKNGNYVFDDLYAGNYKVQVETPSGYYYTKSGLGTSSTGSDVSTSTGTSGVICVAAGETNLTVDAGLYRKASIGDKVWEDKDHDGVQDAGESGIANVKVMLYSNTNQLLATTYTNSSGNYLFSSLDPGSYYLKFDKSNVTYKGYDMDDWKWGVKNVGNNDAIDSDVNGDGISKANVTTTDVTVLTSGENDMSWDAAITPIIIDLNGDGVHTIAASDFHGTFDLLGTGTAINSGWISSNDGFLAIDSNGNGKIDSIAELFGGTTQGAGFAKLADYDSNHDGVVDARDDKFAELRIWRDANSNGMTDAGELMTMKEAGVTSLTVTHTDLPFLDANNNLLLERSSATLASGKSVDMTDVYFNVSAADAAKAGIKLPSMADLLGDDTSLDKTLGATATATATATTATATATVAATTTAAAIDAAAHCDVADVLRKATAAAAAVVAHATA